jgi:hypothetical protein
MKIISIIVSTLLASASASAAPSWGPLEQISSIESSTSGLFVASPSYSTCGSTFTKVVLTDPQAIKLLYAAALAAYLSGKPVRLFTDGCEGAHYRLLGITL